MTAHQAQELLDKIVGQIVGYKNPLSLEDFMKKFAFDIRLPQQVVDAVDTKSTWAQSTNPTRFVRMSNARKLSMGGASEATDFLRPKRPLNGVEDILAAWNEINFTTTERVKDSLNVGESDNIDHSENVFRSQDVNNSKNVIFSDGIGNSESMAASQRSGNSLFCIRAEDSFECTNCFNVSWSAKLTNCFFMQDTGDMQDSMFCTNIKGKRYCIANMQYEPEEYNRIKDSVMRWILTG